MKINTVRLLFLAAAAATGGQASIIFTLLPGAGISGVPGSTVGWGYSITNGSTDYLQPTGLATGSFSGLDPNSIFDFPEIAPGQTVTEQFSTSTLNGPCSFLDCGLYEVMIPNGTAPETVTGTFTISALFYVDAAETNPAGAAPALTANYSLAVLPLAGVPEPGTLALLAAGFAAILARRKPR
jgi:hypothetical protein